GQLSETQSFPADAYIGFHVVIPGSDILIADRPVYPMPVRFIGGKIEVAHPVTVASPHDGPAAHVLASNPVEPLGFVVWVFQIIDEPVATALIDGVACAILFMLLCYLLLRQLSLELIIPGIVVHGGVIIYMLHHTASFEDQGF